MARRHHQHQHQLQLHRYHCQQVYPLLLFRSVHALQAATQLHIQVWIHLMLVMEARYCLCHHTFSRFGAPLHIVVVLIVRIGHPRGMLLDHAYGKASTTTPS
jgi:hypothetical protein